MITEPLNSSGEDNIMITLMVLVMILFTWALTIGLKITWGATKFAFGLSVFLICPLLFVLMVLLGGFAHIWIPIVIIGILISGGLRRA